MNGTWPTPSSFAKCATLVKASEVGNRAGRLEWQGPNWPICMPRDAMAVPAPIEKPEESLNFTAIMVQYRNRGEAKAAHRNSASSGEPSRWFEGGRGPHEAKAERYKTAQLAKRAPSISRKRAATY